MYEMKIFKNSTNNKILLTVIAVALSCRLPREMIWSLYKTIFYHLNTAYQMTDIDLGKMVKETKNVCAERDHNNAKGR